MTEYIEDVRSLPEFSERFPLTAATAHSAIPGFADRFGNVVTVGDWVVVGIRQGNTPDVLLSRVERIEPKAVSKWSPEEVREVVVADVTVRSLGWSPNGLVFKRAAKPNPANMVAYNGKVPDVAE